MPTYQLTYTINGTDVADAINNHCTQLMRNSAGDGEVRYLPEITRLPEPEDLNIEDVTVQNDVKNKTVTAQKGGTE